LFGKTKDIRKNKRKKTSSNSHWTSCLFRKVFRNLFKATYGSQLMIFELIVENEIESTSVLETRNRSQKKIITLW